MNSQICQGISQYGQCSTNTACGCFHMTDANDIGICGFLWAPCSQLVPCGSSNNACDNPDHICVRHPRCNSLPVCYPVSMIDQRICPPIKGKRTNSDLQIQGELDSYIKVLHHLHTPLTYAISVGVRMAKKN